MGTDLNGTDLDSTDLGSTDLDSTDLDSTDLNGTELGGTDIMSAEVPIQDMAAAPPPPAPEYRVLQRIVSPLDGHRGDSRPLYSHGLMFDVDRYRVVIPAHQTVSFGSYFNAFPAAYWRRWTGLDSVQLRVRLRGGGKVTIVRSTSSGLSWSEQNHVVPGDGEVHEVVVDLPLEPFIDGGWYWFDVLAFAGGDVVLEGAEWVGLTDRLERGRLSVGITTFNRPGFCVDQIRNLGDHPALLEILDRVYVVDQGNQRVQDHPDFAQAAAGLGDRLVVIEQGNLGGSGGFARAMYETVESGQSDYLLLLDDDVITEPEGIIRATTFADLARQPVLVGGHMFSIFVRSVLHAYGEAIAKYRWFWGAAPHTFHGHDFGAHPLANTPWLHRRVDVDYNGWWMCLIPTEAIRKIGLALPMFIKWDDADYGLRAGEQGFPTVSLPGVAVWHVPWHEKDDTVDWQAYFHERNRVLSALLHSPYPHGGSLLRESITQTVKHTLAMQYSPAEMILMALEDLLEGPGHLHRDIVGKIDELRAMRKDYDDAKFATDLGEFPPVRPGKPAGRRQQGDVNSRRSALKAMLKVLPRQLSPVPREARAHPQGSLPRVDQQWWRLAQFDSVLVSSADGTSAAWYRRDPQRFQSIMRRNVTLHRELYRRWDELSRLYRDAVPSLSSPDEWQKTFAASEARAMPSNVVRPPDPQPVDEAEVASPAHSDDAPALAIELSHTEQAPESADPGEPMELPETHEPVRSGTEGG
jgi:galactofuranosylgalactofuranosylrhamnosyl-N-acetylglucosaminyl-diphospho-decaprenol beta-1,5/1,6-galactofuranosyltransferase